VSKGNRTRRRESGLLPEPVTCTARNREGNPCRAAPVVGATVCWHHGGAAPQVRRKAEERLLRYSDVLVRELLKIATSADNEAVRLAAVRDALDRIGLGRAREIDIVVKPWEKNIGDLIVDLPEPEPADIVDAEVVERPPPLPDPHDNVVPLHDPDPPRYGTSPVRWQ